MVVGDNCDVTRAANWLELSAANCVEANIATCDADKPANWVVVNEVSCVVLRTASSDDVNAAMSWLLKVVNWLVVSAEICAMVKAPT